MISLGSKNKTSESFSSSAQGTLLFVFKVFLTQLQPLLVLCKWSLAAMSGGTFLQEILLTDGVPLTSHCKYFVGLTVRPLLVFFIYCGFSCSPLYSCTCGYDSIFVSTPGSCSTGSKSSISDSCGWVGTSNSTYSGILLSICLSQIFHPLYYQTKIRMLQWNPDQLLFLLLLLRNDYLCLGTNINVFISIRDLFCIIYNTFCLLIFPGLEIRIFGLAGHFWHKQ